MICVPMPGDMLERLEIPLMTPHNKDRLRTAYTLSVDARDGVMNGLTNVDNILIQQSPYEAIQFVSGSNITNVQINNATIQNTGTWVGMVTTPVRRAKL